MSADPALERYLPVAPISDEAREKNKKLPNEGVFNYFNLAVYHYGNNNPIKYSDPSGEVPFLLVTGAIGAVVGGVVGGVIGAVKSYNETGKVDWKQVGVGAAIGAGAGALIGLTAGAATAYVAAGSATASTSAVVTSISGTATATATGTITALSADGDPTNEVRDVTNAITKTGGELHHIASNKSITSGFTAAYEKIFNKAGMSLDDAANKIFLEGHSGAHTTAYKQYVLDYLKTSTQGLEGTAYKNALIQALNDLKIQLINNPKLPYKGGM